MDRVTFNLDQIRRLMYAEPNLIPKIFVMSKKTRDLFNPDDMSQFLIDKRDVKDDNPASKTLLKLYGKDVVAFDDMPDNIVGIFGNDFHPFIIRHQSNWSADEIKNWVTGPRYIKNAPFRILNIGYIEIGESAYQNLIDDPKSLASHQFIESEIY